MVWCATMVQRLCVQRLNAKIVIGLGVIHNLVNCGLEGSKGSVSVGVIVPCRISINWGSTTKVFKGRGHESKGKGQPPKKCKDPYGGKIGLT